MSVSLSLLAAGCSDDREEARDKCQSLVETYCSRVVSCAQKSDLLDSDFTSSDLRDECQDYMLDNARCEDAVSLSDDFGQCFDRADSLACADIADALQDSSDLDERYLAPLPASCTGAVMYD